MVKNLVGRPRGGINLVRGHRSRAAGSTHRRIRECREARPQSTRLGRTTEASTCMSARKPHILGLGGTSHPNSSTERFLRLALDAAQEAGASTSLLGASALQVPMYRHGAPQCHLIDELVS